MKFGLSQDQTLLQDTVRRFLEEQVPLDLVRKVAAGETRDEVIWSGLTDLGVPGLLIPEAKGGVGLGAMEAALVAELLGYYVVPGPFLSSAVIAGSVLTLSGSHDQLLSELAAGTSRMGVALAEATGVRNDTGLQVKRGRLSGRLLYALDDRADHYLLADRTAALYLVQGRPAGLKVRSLPTVDLTRSTCELILDQVPADKVSEDPEVMQRALRLGRVMQAADTLGAAQRMLDQAVAYAGQRVQFNRVIASFQAVKHLCAEMAADLEPCRSFVWYAAHAQDKVPEEAALQAVHVKAHLAETGKSIAKKATEVHGGMGFTDLLGLHYWFKRIGANRQLLGTPEQMREEAARLQQLA